MVSITLVVYPIIIIINLYRTEFYDINDLNKNLIQITESNLVVYEVLEATPETGPISSELHSFYDNILLIQFFGYVIWFAAMIFIVVFFIITYKIYVQLKISKSFLNFMPNFASQSNPVFKKLLNHENCNSNDVVQFLNELEYVPSNMNFFCILYYDSSDKITKIIGDFSSFFNIRIDNIFTLQMFLLQKFQNDQNIYKNICNFFEYRTEKSTLTIFYKGKDIEFTFFNDSKSILIKDDSYNSYNNLTERLSLTLNDTIDIYSKLPKSIQDVIIIIIEVQNNNDTFYKIKKISEEFNDIIMFDTRNSRLSFFTPNGNTIYLEFLSRISEYIKFLKALVMHESGELTFYDPLKNNVSKGRYMFQSYFKIKFGIDHMKYGDIFIDKELYSEGEEVSFSVPSGEILNLIKFC